MNKVRGNPTRPPHKGGEAGAREMPRTQGTKKVRAGARTLFYIRQTWRMQEGNQSPRDFLISGTRASASAVQRS